MFLNHVAPLSNHLAVLGEPASSIISLFKATSDFCIQPLPNMYWV